MAILAFGTSPLDFTNAGMIPPTETNGAILADFCDEGMRLDNQNVGAEFGLDFEPSSSIWIAWTNYVNFRYLTTGPIMRVEDANGRLIIDLSYSVSTAGNRADAYDLYLNTSTNSNDTRAIAINNFGDQIVNIKERWDIRLDIATAGLIEVYKNGSLIGTFTGNTLRGNPLRPLASKIRFSRTSTSSLQDYDHVISGVMVSDEDTRGVEFVQTLFNANGAKQDFTGGFADISGTGVDDTTFISAENDGDESTFDKVDLPAGVSTGWDILAVGVTARVRAGSNSPIGVELSSNQGASQELSTIQNAQPTFNPISAVFPLDPDTGLAWTVAGVNSAEFGVRVIDTLSPVLQPHTHWRINIITNYNNVGTGLSEMELRSSAGGVDLIDGSAVITYSQNSSSGFPVANLTDGNTTTYWYSAAGEQFGEILVVFATPVEPEELSLRSATPNDTMIADFEVESSPNGITWVSRGIFTANAPTQAAEEQVFQLL